MEKQFDLLPYITVLLRRKWFLLINLLLAIGVSGWYAFCVAKKQYLTSVTFLPPIDKGGLSSLIPGISFGGGGLGGADIMPEQILSIFESQALRRKIIDKFHLIEKYKVAGKPYRYKVALKNLEKDMEIKTNEVGSLGITKLVSYTINTYHTSPDTSYEIAQYMFTMIDSVIRDISTGLGRTNRLFVQSQLDKNKHILDSLQQEFKKFQQKYKAYNVPEQLSATLNNYGQLKALLLSNEFRMRRLMQDYSSDYPEVAALKKSNAVLQGQLQQMEKNSNPEVMVGLELSTELVPTFTNLYRDIEVQNQLILYLSQELEQSKIKEARDISMLNQIDPPFKPLYKVRPKRMLVMAAITGLYMAFLFIALLLSEFYKLHIRNSQTYNEIIRALRNQ
jgi:uncharacterized protein involved in exopolysaccharide biosynthesis